MSHQKHSSDLRWFVLLGPLEGELLSPARRELSTPALSSLQLQSLQEDPVDLTG